MKKTTENRMRISYRSWKSDND